ncbi:hypothetical protein BJ912DRAFT_945189 [Pholiota molesta]|nr:hypothetical protein BJ912DRAFT_945189 [Pholiota molesta]
MPVHFKVAAHEANSMPSFNPQVTNADQLLAATWGKQTRTLRSAELLQTSYHSGKQDFSKIKPIRNGFVDTVTEAYNKHYHLVIKPDDVWTAILGQFNFYVNAHAEELRQHFVQHEGQKKLTVSAVGNRYFVDFGALATRMTELIDENVIDKDLKDWILPDFSTTTKNDTVICAVMMMATLKAYFSFGFSLACGIPSVTLEGEKLDWENLLARIDKLQQFGPEPEAWASLLRPILTRFVKAFDGDLDLDFWGRVCHYHHTGSGPTYLTGWLTAFCVWDQEGVWMGPSLTGPRRRSYGFGSENVERLVLDDTEYGLTDSDKIPGGFCEVDVELDDNGEMFDCMMVSGHLAMKVEGEVRDTVRPLPGWFMFIKETCEDPIAVEMNNFFEGRLGGAAADSGA